MERGYYPIWHNRGNSGKGSSEAETGSIGNSCRSMVVIVVAVSSPCVV